MKVTLRNENWTTKASIIAALVTTYLPLATASELKAPQLLTPDPDLRTASVYKINPWVDAPVILGSTAWTLYAYADASNLIHKHKEGPFSPNDVNSFDRPAVFNYDSTAFEISNLTVTASLLGPAVWSYATLGLSQALAEDLTVFLEVAMVNQALVTAAKFGFARPYPHRLDPSNQTTPEALDFLSFYSGHTATAFSSLSAFSMTYQYRNGPTLWPWLLTGIVGTSVAYELVKSGEHYTTDVIVGALAGTAVGILIPALHHRDEEDSKKSRSHFSVMASSQSLGLRWQLFI